MGKPNDEPTVMIDVDTSNFELYKNKRLSTLPSGEYNMIMDIDYWNGMYQMFWAERVDPSHVNIFI